MVQPGAGGLLSSGLWQRPVPIGRRRKLSKECKMMKNWQLGAILGVVAVLYCLFWLNMTTR